MKKILLALTILFVSNHAKAVTEVDFGFGYDKSVFGEKRDSKSTTRTYRGSIAFYFFNMTAIEFNYSEEEDETIINNDTSGISSGLVIDSESQTITSQRYGIGIRQALANRKAFLVPTISIGWARQKSQSRSTARIVDKGTSATTLYDSGVSESEYDSVFGAFALKLRLTKTMSLKGSINTAFKAFEWDKARDQLSYSAGLSWIF
jgi:hypothetical protein